MVLLKIETQINTAKRSEFEQAIRFIIDFKVKDSIEHRCRIFQNIEMPESFIYMQEWDNDDQIHEYMKTDGFKSLIGSMKVLGEIKSACLISSECKDNILPDIT